MQKKRAYEKPRMIDLGEVSKLTLAHQDGLLTDANLSACEVAAFSRVS
jgi:hypothetical protein